MIPISINKDWNIITRTIVPVIWMPSLGPDIDSTNGIGDTLFTAFLSPANSGKWIWGAGPVLQVPTNTSDELGNGNWGLGASVVLLHLDHGDPWVYGALVNNIWSLTSEPVPWRRSRRLSVRSCISKSPATCFRQVSSWVDRVGEHRPIAADPQRRNCPAIVQVQAKGRCRAVRNQHSRN